MPAPGPRPLQIEAGGFAPGWPGAGNGWNGLCLVEIYDDGQALLEVAQRHRLEGVVRTGKPEIAADDAQKLSAENAADRACGCWALPRSPRARLQFVLVQ